MSKNQNLDTGGQFAQNQNNAMSDDPRDGGRNSFTAHSEGGGVEPAPDKQDQARIEALGRRGAAAQAGQDNAER